jgi:hypothetical protein
VGYLEFRAEFDRSLEGSRQKWNSWTNTSFILPHFANKIKGNVSGIGDPGDCFAVSFALDISANIP